MGGMEMKVKSKTKIIEAENNEIDEELEETLNEQFPKGKCKERGQALVLFAKANIKIKDLEEARDTAFLENNRLRKQLQEYKRKILDWCYKNNTIPMKDLYSCLRDSKLRLCTTDGGWINLLNLQKFLDTL